MSSTKTEKLKNDIKSLSLEDSHKLLETAIYEMETLGGCNFCNVPKYFPCRLNNYCYTEILNYLIKQTNDNEDNTNIHTIKR